MKKMMFAMAAAALAVGCVTKDPYDIRPEGEDDGVPTAVAWQNANDAALEAAMKPQVLAAYVQSAAAADALLAEAKPAYRTDPLVATRIAAVTQPAPCPKSDKAPAGRAGRQSGASRPPVRVRRPAGWHSSSTEQVSCIRALPPDFPEPARK